MYEMLLDIIIISYRAYWRNECGSYGSRIPQGTFSSAYMR